MYLEFLLFLTIVWITRRIYGLFPTRYQINPIESHKDRASAIAWKILKIVWAKNNPDLIPYAQGAAPIENAIARKRASLVEPGGIGVNVLDKFESTWRIFLHEAQTRKFFQPGEYARALLSVISESAPGDRLREEIVVGMTDELKKQFPGVAPLIKKYRKASVRLIYRKQLIAMALK